MDYLPFALPDTGDEEVALAEEVIRSGWITTGPKTKQLEAEFAAQVGAAHALAVNSCTAAMHLTLEAIGIRAGDEIITSPYTFAATAEVIRYFDARPVFVDVDRRTLNIDAAAIQGAITERTRAIIPVHIAGLAADLDGIGAIAREHGLRVVEDAAHALPSTHCGRRIGSISDATCFSFYASKPLCTGEGGMLCSDDPELVDRARMMSLHGISRDAWKRYTADGSWEYEILAPGFKYNLTDLASALGLAQLRKLERMWARRQAIAAAYNSAFGALESVETPAGPPIGEQHSWHLYMLRLHLQRLDIDRAAFVEELRARGIGVSVHFIPLHIHPYYRERYGSRPQDCPVAYEEYLREISLPIYSRMSDGDVARVVHAVAAIARTHAR